MQTMRCPTFAECGGCPLIAHTPEEARRHRENHLRDALREYLGEDTAELPIDWIGRPQPDGYRRRIRLRIFDDGRVGFFNEAKYRDCTALTPALRRLLSEFLDGAAQHRALLGFLRHLELREPDLDQRAAVYFTQRDPTHPLPEDVRYRLREWLKVHHFAIANGSCGVPYQRLALPSVWQYVPICSFLQVNDRINQALVSSLVADARLRRLTSFCDLYAGSGNFALPLLASGLTGCGVEVDPVASTAARRAAAEQSLSQADFVSRDAEAFAIESLAKGRSFDLVVIDPPRAGVRNHLSAMAGISRHSLVYCSCNVRSLARDLAIIRDAGFEVETTRVFDMFEHTEHIETMAWLRKRS